MGAGRERARSPLVSTPDLGVTHRARSVDLHVQRAHTRSGDHKCFLEQGYLRPSKQAIQFVNLLTSLSQAPKSQHHTSQKVYCNRDDINRVIFTHTEAPSRETEDIIQQSRATCDESTEVHM